MASTKTETSDATETIEADAATDAGLENSETSSPSKGGTDFRLLVFLTALAVLMFELVVSRLADFHLGAENSYLAIPITFLGLALGSLEVHFRPKLIETFSVMRQLVILAVLSFVALMTVFVVFSWWMPVTSAIENGSNLSYLAYKMAVFIAVMVTPFYVFGRILTISYQLNRDQIGKIYSADFAGAALACAATPLAFHWSGLPTVVLLLLVVIFVPVIVFAPAKRRALVGVVVLLVSFGGRALIDHIDSSLNYERYRTGWVFTEIAHGWNEHSRVAVVKREKEDSDAKPRYTIIHNNSRSNVRVSPYKPYKKARKTKRIEGMEAAFVLGRIPEKVLVMFAGCGAQMIKINAYAGNKADITGVEINGLVPELARSVEELEDYRIAEFLDLEHIDLQVEEGRHFLASAPDDEKYDLIYMGSNASTITMTGHSRKYLDTMEAYSRYLDLLAPGGLLVFDHQPLPKSIRTLRKLFEARGLGDLSDKVIIVDSSASNDDMFVSPTGFTEEEKQAVIDKVPAKKRRRVLRYVPGTNYRSKKYEEPLFGEIAEGDYYTDDRPFRKSLQLDEYQLMPEVEYLEKPTNYLAWIKVTTLIVMSGIALFFMGIASIKKSTRVPPSILVYLVITGFGFMLCEIAMMAKMELFLQKPILSMAAVLSLFLLTSGIGSAIFDRVRSRLNMVVFPLIVAAVVFVSGPLVDYAATNLLWMPTAARLLLCAAMLLPLGVCLGLFYPYAVTCLDKNGRGQSVGITYGISTLASVVGATYAMTMMIDLGFNALLDQAVYAYALLAVFVLVYGLAGGKLLRFSE